ncbi:MAG: hypothetical protein EZS28_035020, partial [Streblomastix strix]
TAAFYILTIRTLNLQYYATSAVSPAKRQTMSGFSGGIKCNVPQLRVRTGKELNIGFSWLRSSNPLNVISLGILQQNGVPMVAAVAYLSISQMHKSLREFPLITAYSHASIAYLHNVVASFNCDSASVSVGIANYYARSDHVHPLNITTTIPFSDSASGSVGTANNYARSDHSHPFNITTAIPPQDGASGSVGTTNYYARNDHSHAINVETNASNIPIVNGVGANGTSAFYARQDHVHPQQLTYDGNVILTKFIKTGRTNNDILLANGDTKKSVLASKSYQVIEQPQYIKLCTFIALNATTDNSIELKINIRTGFGQIQFNQHWTQDIGIDKYQYLFIPSLSSGLNSAWIIYFGSSVDRYGELWCKIDDYTYNTYIYEMKVNAFQGNITNILSTDCQSSLPTGYSCIQQLIANSYGSMQVNPTTNQFSQGIRIARSTNSNYSGIFLGCDPLSTTGSLQDQWNIVNTPTGQFRIGVNDQITENNQGLMISNDGSTLSFNGNQFVDLATNQVIAAKKIFTAGLDSGNIQINPTATGYDDGLRISRSEESTGGSSLTLGCSRFSNTGAIAGQWQIFTPPSYYVNNPLGITLQLGFDSSETNRGLYISADGNTLSFNGQIIAGTGAPVGSVNYSAGNPILWGVRSLGTDGGINTDGTAVFWRDHALQFDPYYPG